MGMVHIQGGRLELHRPIELYAVKRDYKKSLLTGKLYEEIKARGYTGSASLLRGFIADLRKQRQAGGSAAALALVDSHSTANIPAELPPQPPFTRRLSPSRTSWLCVSKPAKLDEKHRRQVDQIREGHTDLETAYQLSQALLFVCCICRIFQIYWLMVASLYKHVVFRVVRTTLH